MSMLRDRGYSFLRWTERFTKTDMVYLAENAAWLITGQVVLALMAFGTSVAFGYFVPKDTYGTYRFLLSLFWTLTAFTLSGLPIALTRAIARGEQGAFRQALRLSVLWSWPFILISACVSAYYIYLGNLVLGYGVLFIMFIGPFMQSAYLYGAFLEGKREFKSNSKLGIILNAVPAVALIAGMYFHAGALGFLVLYLGGTAIAGLSITGIVYLRYRTQNPRVDAELMRTSGHFSIMNILSTIAQQTDRILIFHFIGAAPLAIYAFATSIPDQIKSMASSVATLAFPKFANQAPSLIRKALSYRLWGFTVGIALLSVAYIFAAPYIFRIFFPAYLEAVFYSQLYVLTLVSLSNTVPIAVLQAHAAHRQLYIFNIFSPLFQIIALLVGVLWFGLIGAIIARILARIFNMLLVSLLMRSFWRAHASS